MTSKELASLMLICTSALIDVVVCCTGGPSNMADLRRVASIRLALSDYIRLVEVGDVASLMAALGYEEEDGD